MFCGRYGSPAHDTHEIRMHVTWMSAFSSSATSAYIPRFLEHHFSCDSIFGENTTTTTTTTRIHDVRFQERQRRQEGSQDLAKLKEPPPPRGRGRRQADEKADLFCGVGLF